MIICYCPKCGLLDVLNTVNDKNCIRCNTDYLSLGVDSAQWNCMDKRDKNELIRVIEDKYGIVHAGDNKKINNNDFNTYISGEELTIRPDEEKLKSVELSDEREHTEADYIADESDAYNNEDIIFGEESSDKNTSKKKEAKRKNKKSSTNIEGILLSVLIALIFVGLSAAVQMFILEQNNIVTLALYSAATGAIVFLAGLLISLRIARSPKNTKVNKPIDAVEPAGSYAEIEYEINPKEDNIEG